MRNSTLFKALKKNSIGRAKEKLEHAKATSERAEKLSTCFHVVKCLFKHRKTLIAALAKNNAHCTRCSLLQNLVLEMKTFP
ncbi:hypothetical protein D3872_17550 [Massilia cavernae]|uniref:Uncharacterized protein n=1 Tax=Massilia cavernae TaxID=2320864 RepID=A0A418XPZ6_9BURK|nr:hypothetical protein D3872_17550 [Massilia cavernae]